MATEHYSINELDSTNKVNLVNDFNQSMIDVDSVIYNNVTAINDNVTAINDNITTINDNIDVVKNDINNLETELNIDIFRGTNQSDEYDSITCTLVHNGTNFVLIDTGYSNDASSIESWLKSFMNNNKLDALIMTHMHADHVGNYNSILTNFCDADTDIFIQMRPTTANGEYSVYSDYYNLITNQISTLNLKNSIVPTQGQKHTYGNMNVIMYNTNVDYKSDYDKSWANNGKWDSDATGDDKPCSGLNNYSIVTRIECGQNSYIDTGDIEYCAQVKMANVLEPAIVFKNPHHFYNKMGYEKFYQKCGIGSTVQCVVCTNHLIESTETRLIAFDVLSSYMGRYLVYKQNDTPIISNVGTDIGITIKNGAVIRMDGTYIDKDFILSSYAEGNINWGSLYTIFPPNYVPKTRQISDGTQLTYCPYDAHYISLDNLWELKRLAIGCPSIPVSAGIESTAILSTSKIASEVKEYFNAILDSPMTTASRVVIDLGGAFPTVTRNAVAHSETTTANKAYSFFINLGFGDSTSSAYHTPAWIAPLKYY